MSPRGGWGHVSLRHASGRLGRVKVWWGCADTWCMRVWLLPARFRVGVVSVPVSGESASVVVTAEVLSATSVSVDPADLEDAGACLSGEAGVTDMGSFLPGGTLVTSEDCVVSFGSSNDTAMLSVRQADGAGRAMYQRTQGQLRPSFADDGLLLLDEGDAATMRSEFNAVGVQSNGRIVAGGYVFRSGYRRFTVAGFMPDGSPDASFGDDGYVTLWESGDVNLGVQDIMVLDDDRILAVGGWNLDSRFAMLLPDGSPDPSAFGGDGLWVPAFGNDFYFPWVIRRQADGKFLISGQAYTGGCCGFDVVVL